MKTNHSRNNSGGIICYCIGCPGADEDGNSSCLLKEGAQCFASVTEVTANGETELVYSAGCFADEQQSTLQCHADLVPADPPMFMKCCNFTDFCNKNLHSSYKPRIKATPPELTLDNFYVAPMFVFSAVFVVVCAVCTVILFCRYKKGNGSRKCLTKLESIKVSKRNNFHNYTHSSGSGDGQQLLARRTIGREVKKERLLGKGRFGEKWIVDWKGEKIVMKTFTTWEEDQWAREKSIYATGLNHINVLGFICSDYMRDGLRATFTYYHQKGSLHDYIKKQCLSDSELLTLARSAANGVQILHKEIRGTCTRPSIVHRNITSKNYLINDRGECEICDFEVALMESEKFDLKMEMKVGTPRYTAPEVVEEMIYSFEGFKMADVYSLGLVLWEMCRRSVSLSEDYALPFADILPEYPTMEDMKDLFASKKSIHEMLGIQGTWKKDKLLSAITSIVQECATESCKSRPTIVRICMHLSELEL